MEHLARPTAALDLRLHDTQAAAPTITQSILKEIPVDRHSRHMLRVTSESDAGLGLSRPLQKITPGSAVVSVTGHVRIPVYRQRIQGRPTVVPAPLCNFLKVVPHCMREIRDIGALTEDSIWDNCGRHRNMPANCPSVYFSMMIK